MAIYTIKTLTENDLPNPLISKDNYTTIVPSDNIYENGKKLINLCEENKNKKDYTIFLLPGTYDLSGKNIALNGSCRLIGLADDNDLVKIQSYFSGKGSGVIHEENGNACLNNLSIENIFTGIENYWIQPTHDLENGTINNTLKNNPFVRSAFSSNTRVMFASGNNDNNKILFEKKYIYDNDLGKYRIAFQEITKEKSNSCRYIVQSEPTEIEKNILNLNDYKTETSFLQSNLQIFSIGIWKLVSGVLNGNSLSINSTIAVENPKLNNNYNPLSNRSLKYTIQGWPWLVKNWVLAGITPMTACPSGVILGKKTSYIKNVNFLRGPQSLSMNAPSYYGGDYIDCQAAECSFGGNGGFLEGNFINCQSLSNSFAPQYHRSGSIGIRNFKMQNCYSEAYSFGSLGALESGVMKDCTAGKRDFNIQTSEIGEVKDDVMILNLTQVGKTGWF